MGLYWEPVHSGSARKWVADLTPSFPRRLESRMRFYGQTVALEPMGNQCRSNATAIEARKVTWISAAAEMTEEGVQDRARPGQALH